MKPRLQHLLSRGRIHACRLVMEKFQGEAREQPSCEQEHFWKERFASIFEVQPPV
ncbi:hypothetical protein AFE_1329 [Acidithiobacillus ferrooxidans ATCC 23270]|uniref:Uncharacterized protein n=1 Tax=Acidithiobacillus ferrooxidans (strain ATCC 23270 / DSM 14882 / CIP 104768 / NCIMB 8455) TaxID=243159 RepID=B7J9D4_ACIF2|nr:hypothetical protein AFE_1329 [Acidithiobacillus ferrooxidans ATCC 23270]